METLKPCPFCGGNAKLQQYDGGGVEPSSAMIDCDSCSTCSTDWQPTAKIEDSLSKARELWNTRYDAPDAELLGKLEKDMPKGWTDPYWRGRKEAIDIARAHMVAKWANSSAGQQALKETAAVITRIMEEEKGARKIDPVLLHTPVGAA